LTNKECRVTANKRQETVEPSIAFPYSPVWRLLAFFVPVGIFAFAIRGFARTATDPTYLIVAIACAAISVWPHLFIAGTLSGAVVIGHEGVTRRWLWRRHRLRWSRILEVRDFLNQIQVIPAKESDTIYVQFYHNLVRPTTFHKALINGARKYEVNLMLRPTTRRFLPIRWKSIVLLGLIVGTGLALLAVRAFRTRQYGDVMVIGLLAGCTYTTVSAALWMTVSKSHKRIRAQALLFYSLYVAVLLMPLLVLGGREIGKLHINLLVYTLAYLFGFFSGSGLLGLFYPNRDIDTKDHASEVFGAHA
jgi:hypothetical protein